MPPPCVPPGADRPLRPPCYATGAHTRVKYTRCSFLRILGFTQYKTSNAFIWLAVRPSMFGFRMMIPWNLLTVHSENIFRLEDGFLYLLNLKYFLIKPKISKIVFFNYSTSLNNIDFLLPHELYETISRTTKMGKYEKKSLFALLQNILSKNIRSNMLCFQYFL